MSRFVVKTFWRIIRGCQDGSWNSANWTPKLRAMISQIPIHLPGKPDEGMGYCISHYLGIASYVMLLMGLGLDLYSRWWMTGDTSIFIIALIGILIFGFNVVLCYYFSFYQLSAYISHLWFGSLLGLVTFTQWTAPSEEPLMSPSSDLSKLSPRHHPHEQQRLIHFDDFNMNILLVVSLLLQANWILFARATRRSTAVSGFLKAPEMLELAGMGVAGLLNDRNSWQIVLLTSAFALALGLLRLKSSLGLVNLLLFFFLTLAFILPSFHVPTSSINFYALGSFAGRHLAEPVVDLYFNGLSPMERWRWFLHRHATWRKGAFFIFLLAQIAYCVHLGTHVPNHASFLIMTPIYAVFGFVWSAYHLIVFITCWCLMNKLSECLVALKTIELSSSDCSSSTLPATASAPTATISLSRIMAARGVRHMCLIARRLASISAVMTFILTLVGWRVKTGLTLAFHCNVLPLDLLVLSLVVDLSASLGGTCAGFSLVVPSSPVRATPTSDVNPFPAILPPRTIEIISERATQTLNLVQRFFAVHLIDNCGSEYSSSGLNVESLQDKLKKFFAKKTNDQLPFDSYLLYYSGPTHASGDWAMSDNGVMTLQSLVDTWMDAQSEHDSDPHQSRLIVIVDSDHAHKWKKPLGKIRSGFIALQTFYPHDVTKKNRHDSDPENIDTPLHGAFTRGFTRFNVTASSSSDEDNVGGGGGVGKDDEVGMGGGVAAALDDDPTSSSSWFADFMKNGIRPTYGVTRSWSDFTFKLPSIVEFENFSQTHFPRLLLPVIRFSTLPFVFLSSLCCCVESAWKMARRCKLAWFPPAVLNIGHDFKLMRC